MLKSKKGIYVLLPLVVFVWGAIIYQIIDAFSDEEPLLVETTIIKTKDIAVVAREKFEIKTLERDPFLGTVYVKKKQQPVVIKNREAKKEFLWPNIQYKGEISDVKTSKAIFLIAINNIEYILEKKETAAEVTIIKGDNAAITIKYKGRIKKIPMLE